MGLITIHHDSFPVEGDELLFYHCAADEGDWSLALTRPGRRDERLYLSGTVSPPPHEASEVAQRRLSVELRSFDEMFRALLGRPVTIYPQGEAGEVFLSASSVAGGRFRLFTSFAFDWDRALGTFAGEGIIRASIDVLVSATAFFPDQLP